MPASGVVPGDNTQPYTWVTVDDFTPGVYDYSRIAGLGTNTQQNIVPAPMGAANSTGTYACCALPKGGLGPLPGISQSFAYSPEFPGGVHYFYITMMTVNPSLNNGDVEVIIGLEGDDGTIHHYTKIYSADLTSSSSNLLRNATDPTTPGIFGAPYPTWSRMIDSTDSPTTTPGAPILAFPGSVVTDSHTTSGHLFVYPSNGSNKVYPWGGTVISPGTPTFSLADLVTAGSEVTGQLVGYQNRLVTFSGIGYPWPISTFNVNEQICFTDPPNSNDFGFQQTILSPENPFGYGGAGSISAGELFMVKKQGGGVVLTGDIFSPSQVTPYPGIQSTGDFYGKAGATRDGLVYCSQNNGAWIWNGGNSSTKISTQLDDNFFDCTTDVIDSNNYGYFVQRWGDLILFSNNYVYDTITSSWWILDDVAPPTGPYFHYSLGVTENTMYASPIRITPSGGFLTWINEYDTTVPAAVYEWESLPIRLVDDHLVDVRQFVIRASMPTGTNGKVTLNLSGSNGVTAGPYVSPVVGTGPQDYRFNTALLGAQDVIVSFTSEGSSNCPTIHSFSFAHQPTTHVPTSN